MDKSPFYFSFTQVPGFDSPVVYVLGTYFNGGLTLQHTNKNLDPTFGPPQAIPGTSPELSFEITVSTPKSTQLSNNNNNNINNNNNNLINNNKDGSQIVSDASTNIDGWGLAFLIFIAVLALLAIGYALYLMFIYYTQQQKQTQKKSNNDDQPPPFDKNNGGSSKSKKRNKIGGNGDIQMNNTSQDNSHYSIPSSFVNQQHIYDF